MSEYFSFGRVIEYFPKLITSFPTTLIIVVAALAVGIVLGIILAFIRIHKIPVLYPLSCVYVSFIRGTPQIIQLFLVYYGMPLLFMNLFGIDLNRVDALLFVIVAYGLNESAFLSEIFRGGLSAIPSGQYEAGYACGLTKILMGAFTKHYTENYFCTAVVFIVVSILLELLFNLLNKKLQYVKK